jgi:surface polysaccharide O-acyltransferase-like enzyme
MDRVETLKKIHRHEGIDVLRVIAIFMIVISHSLPRYGNHSNPGYIDFAQAQRNLPYFVCATFFYFGQIGNCIFIICSSWFLADDDEIKYKKVVHLISDTFCISVLWLLVIWLCKFNLSITDLVKSFFPITFGYNWFVGCYILFYLLHKVINKSTKNMPMKKILLYRINRIYSVIFVDKVFKKV